jgi:transcription initiation factor IIE alpha subunit
MNTELSNTHVRAISYTLNALSLIRKEPTATGSIVCPKCGGKLFYNKSSNGHTAGKCETQDCLTWIQ